MQGFLFLARFSAGASAQALRGNVRLSPLAGSEGRLLFQAFSASKPDVESASSYQ